MSTPTVEPRPAGGRRWDSDTRFTGVGDATAVRAAVGALHEICSRPGWVAEDADVHLGLHLRRACAQEGSPWRWLGGEQQSDGTYVVDLAHRSDDLHAAYRNAVALLATIAENSVAVRRVDRSTVEAVTGMLPGDGDFAAHGHTVRLRIVPDPGPVSDGGGGA